MNKEKYFDETSGWERNRVATVYAAKRRSNILNIFLLSIVAIMAAAIALLTPLKTVDVKVLVVDKSTGLIEPLRAPETVHEDIDDLFTKKFITDFMNARENYTYDTAEINYFTAAAFMSSTLQTQWGNFWDTTSPDSPLNVYSQLVKVFIDINSVTIEPKLSGRKDVATVRFKKTISDGQQQLTTSYIATITYKYVQSPTSERLLRINPLGFTVVDYRVSEEISGISPVRKELGS